MPIEIVEAIGKICVRNLAHSEPICRCFPRYYRIPIFDGIMRKWDFINWIFNLKYCFNYWKNHNDEKEILQSNKLDSDAVNW